MDHQVEKYGFQKILKFLTSEESTQLNKHFLTVRNESGVDDAVVEFTPERFFRQFPDISDRVVVLMSNQLGYRGLHPNKIWNVHTTSAVFDKKKLPFIPHFDNERYLKLIVYLNDVSETNGAFWASQYDVNSIETRRLELPEDYKKRKLNSFEGGHVFKPVVGNAGDAILFDTNCPHYAGIVSSGTSRHILRFDFELPEWNSHLRNSSRKSWFFKAINSIFRSRVISR